MDLAEEIYRIANFAPEDREAPLTGIDRPGLEEVRAALTLWQIVVNDNVGASCEGLSDLSNSELAEMMGTRNDIFAGTIDQAIEKAMKDLKETTEQQREDFYDEEAPMEYDVTDEADGKKITAKIDGDVWCEVTIYPVTILRP